jgi:hypothetical protein
LLASVHGTLDPGDEPTDADMERIRHIHHELEGFQAEFARELGQQPNEAPPSPPPKRESERLGEQPIEAEHRERMNVVALTLDEFFNADRNNRKTGFVLLVFPYGNQNGRCNYISNGADRKDIVTLFKEQIARFEGQPEMEGHA